MPRKRRREESERKTEREEDKQDTQAIENQSCQPASTPTTMEDLFFYLYRPNTLSKYKCLIPISKLGSIGEALQGRTLLEFPTIYVRGESPESLVEPFITESEYLHNHGSDIPVNLPSFGNIDVEEGEITALPDNIDDSKILAVLQKDAVG